MITTPFAKLFLLGVLTITGAVELGAKMPAGSHPVPAFFVSNTGQYVDGVDFVVQAGEIQAEFRDREVRYRMPGVSPSEVRVRYESTRVSRASGLEELSGKVNFLIGADQSAWRTGVPTYSTVAYRDLWTGIDAVYSTNGGTLKTEFQIAPGASPNSVAWQVEGADSVGIERDGSLVIGANGHLLRECAPQVFEQDRTTNELRPVKGSFRLFSGNRVGIAVGAYDPANRLIFDPVIGYSTYLGGSGQSAATAIAVDTAGNEVVAGYTTSFDFASGSFAVGQESRVNAYVAKLTAAGNQLIFCTYIGGSLTDEAFALALDRYNNIYIAGMTTSTNFPVVKALQPAMRGTQDAFVTELSATGSSLVFSTYFGGSSSEQINGIVVNSQGYIYVAGDTQSTDLPVVNAFQPASGGGQDAFVAKLSIYGTGIQWSSYLGGSADEHAAGIAVEASGAVSVAGSTFSSNFPVVNAVQPMSGGNQDAFVTKIVSAGNAIVFSTYLGGAGGTPGLLEGATGIAIDAFASIYVTGSTSSTNFPVTTGAFEVTAPGSSVNGFVTKLSPTGSFIYSTYLGGSSVTYSNAIAVDVAGNAHVVGYTSSPDFPSVRPLQTGLRGVYDLFVTKFNSTGTGLIYSTLFGGTQTESAAAVALDRFGNVLVAGQTLSTDFPTASAYQTTLRGEESSIVMRLPVGWKPTVVAYAPNATWSTDYLRNGGTNGVSPAVQTTVFGIPGDIPIAGDWTGTGTQHVGVFRSGVWYLDIDGDGLFTGNDRSFSFGAAGDIPVVGDWNGSGSLKAGLYRNGTFYLDLSGHLSGIATGLKDVSFAFGLATDIPVAADWNGSGKTKVGVFRNGQWLLDWNGTNVINGPAISYGIAGDVPLAGDWDGSGTVKVGVYRKGEFLLDYNGNRTYDQYGDLAFTYGAASPYAMMMY